MLAGYKMTNDDKFVFLSILKSTHIVRLLRQDCVQFIGRCAKIAHEKQCRLQSPRCMFCYERSQYKDTTSDPKKITKAKHTSLSISISASITMSQLEKQILNSHTLTKPLHNAYSTGNSCERFRKSFGSQRDLLFVRV